MRQVRARVATKEIDPAPADVSEVQNAKVVATQVTPVTSPPSWLAPPDSFGFNAAHFADWRPSQPAAIKAVLESDRRFTALVLPTGEGKSLTYMALARLTGWRTVILTSTKALQDQIARDFDGMVTILKGQSSYPCHALSPGGQYADWNPDGTTRGCHEGPCHAGMVCGLKGEPGQPSQCAYFSAVAKALRAPLVVTNYACYLAHRLHAIGLGKIDCLVLDEAHAGPDELASALRVELSKRDLDALTAESWPASLGWTSLHGWAARCAEDADRLLETRQPQTRAEAQYHRILQRVANALNRLRGCDPDVTVVREQFNKLTIEPVWAATYNDALWKDIPHIVCTSATVRPKTLELLGVGASETTWYESQGSFPIARRPVYLLNMGRVDHRMSADQEAWWLSGIDDILRARPDVKGVIHTVSYARRNRILQTSQFRDRLITHDREDTAAKVEMFKRADGPRVLVSPSVTTGYDFPGAACRFAIIGKVPFPDSRDPITARRSVLDPEYPMYVAMQEVVQMTGRGMRSMDDWCETFIIDGHASWFLKKYRTFAPAWFTAAVKTIDTIPRAPHW